MKIRCFRDKVWKWRPGRLRSESGMTLTEMLAALLILSMTAVAIGGGVVTVKNAYRKTTEKAEAQQVLATTIELITDELANAVDEEIDNTKSWEFQSGENGAWISLNLDAEHPEYGIGKVYRDADSEHQYVPLMTSKAMADLFYTDFDSCTYQDGCFTIENLAVYYKSQINEDTKKVAAQRNKLVVRAINLEGKN